MEVRGDIITCGADYIVHQCNCMTTIGKGLSLDMFAAYPHSDIYSRRRTADVPGKNIIVALDGHPTIVNMLAQRSPGKSTYQNDTPQMRIQWFKQCLDHLATVVVPGSTIAFPYKIGCGMARGSWPTYEEMLIKFSESVKVKNCVVKIMRK